MPSRMVVESSCLVAGGRCEETHVVVRSPSFPRAFDGFVAIQLTDLHFGRWAGFAGALAEYVLAETPDAWFLTGDLVENGAGIAHARGVLGAVRPGASIYFVPGNNDNSQIRRSPRLLDTLREAGVTVLINEAAHLERSGERIWLAGVDDPSRERGDIDAALSGIAGPGYTIVLSHCIDILPRAAQRGAEVVVCGHSHGGQVCLPWIGPLISGSTIGGRRLAKGIHEVGNTPAYVCRGIGTSLLPFRLWCRREITRYTFRTEEAT